MYYNNLEKEIERLELELEDADPDEALYIISEIREIEREIDDMERWQDEGFERGWM